MILEELASRGVKLTEAERMVLLGAGIRTADALISLTRTFPSLSASGLIDAAKLSLAVQGRTAALAAAGAEAGPAWQPRRFAAGAAAPSGVALGPGTTVPLAPIAAKASPLPTGTIWGLPPTSGAGVGVGSFAAWPVRDQGARGTCVAHAAVGMAETTVGFTDLSEQHLFWATKKHHCPHNGVDGTMLCYARSALATHGVCDEHAWPYDATPDPHDVAHDLRRPSPMPIGATRQANLKSGGASAVLAELQAGRTVAITLPVVQDPLDSSRTNWSTPMAEFYGEVMDPPPTMVSCGLGHAVLVVGFSPDSLEPAGGHFVIRNSWGVHWGSRLPAQGRYAPARGYGTISASYVQNYLWEALTT